MILIRITVFTGLTILLSACANFSYYAQAIGGHFSVVHRAQPIDSVLANPDVDPKTKSALIKVTQIREFASRELKLPDNLSYTSYADLGRPFVVWNVFAAPEFSLKLKEWCLLQVGCVSYRGFFSRTQAEQFAMELKKEGYDVHMGGVRAYSTLGWFADPVLNTFIDYSEMNLARLIFHELAHQVIFVPGDSMFNESFATAVEQEGILRWFAGNGAILQQTELQARRAREVVFIDLLAKHRKQLQELFRSGRGDEEKRAQKQQIIADLRAEFMQLKTTRPEFASYEQWFMQPLNNAVLATVSLYTQFVPAFRTILAQHDHDMEKFFVVVKKLGEMPKDERHRLLRNIMENHSKVVIFD